MKEMNRELMDLRQQLGMTTKGLVSKKNPTLNQIHLLFLSPWSLKILYIYFLALTNEIYRKPFADAMNESKHDTSFDRITSARIFRTAAGVGGRNGIDEDPDLPTRFLVI